MRIVLKSKFNIGDKVYLETYLDQNKKKKTVYTIKDILVHGSVSCYGFEYIISAGNTVKYVFEDELVLTDNVK